MLDHLHQSRRVDRESVHRSRGTREGRAGDRAGRLPRDRNRFVRRRPFPRCPLAESEYVTVGSDRTVNLLQQAVDPAGESLPDWEIIARVAQGMGFGDAFDYSSAQEIFEEITGFANPQTGYDLRGMTYDRLREGPVQWPCPPESAETRHPVRYLNDGTSRTPVAREDGSRPRLAFATPDGRARFFPRPHMPAAEMPDDDHPFVLNTGRVQHQWHTLTKTGKVEKLTKLNPGPFVEIDPDDAQRLSIVDGDRVEIASRRGRAVLPAVVTDRVLPGNCFAPFHWNDLFGDDLAINAVTNDAVDPASLQPEFKVCAVSVEKVAGAVEPVLESGSVLDRLESALGLETIPVPTFDDIERGYLAGLLAGLRTADITAAPTLPPTAPFPADKRHGSTACSPGCTRTRPRFPARRPPSGAGRAGRRRGLGIADG